MTKLQLRQFPRTLSFVVALAVLLVVQLVAMAQTDTGRIVGVVRDPLGAVVSLPLNDRQLSQLYLQAPGSVNSGSGTFGDIRFSGRAVQQNIVRFDGVEGSAIIDASPGNLNGEIATPFPWLRL